MVIKNFTYCVTALSQGNLEIESISKQQNYICIQNDPIAKIFPKDTLNFCMIQFLVLE